MNNRLDRPFTWNVDSFSMKTDDFFLKKKALSDTVVIENLRVNLFFFIGISGFGNKEFTGVTTKHFLICIFIKKQTSRTKQKHQ